VANSVYYIAIAILIVEIIITALLVIIVIQIRKSKHNYILDSEDKISNKVKKEVIIVKTDTSVQDFLK